MNLRSLRVLTLLAVPLLGASGCTIINTDGEFADCTFGCPGAVCGGNSDCHSSCSCNNGTCEPRRACTTASQCTVNETCTNGRCQPACTVNSDCTTGQFCLSGSCRAVTE